MKKKNKTSVKKGSKTQMPVLNRSVTVADEGISLFPEFETKFLSGLDEGSLALLVTARVAVETNLILGMNFVTVLALFQHFSLRQLSQLRGD